MAKCENCYHARACLNSLSENKVLNNTEVFACEHYKDKSLIVELPCKVKSKYYTIDKYCDKYDEGKLYIARDSDCYYCTNGTSECNGIFKVTEHTFRDVCDIIIAMKSIGKNIFLSREEAERTLEKCEKNG